MKNTVLFLVGCVAFVWGCLALGGVYEIEPIDQQAGPMAWRLNRLTGEVAVCMFANKQLLT
jgi:hypothetical protein